MAAEIHQHMTVGAWVASSDQPLAIARETMQEAGIRHLPVLADGNIVGLLSARDLNFLEQLPGVSAELTVEKWMLPDPYIVEPEAAVSTVVREMARRKIGSAIVARGGTVIGIFTTVDALELLANTLD